MVDYQNHTLNFATFCTLARKFALQKKPKKAWKIPYFAKTFVKKWEVLRIIII
jgi:hypothetical protein